MMIVLLDLLIKYPPQDILVLVVVGSTNIIIVKDIVFLAHFQVEIVYNATILNVKLVI
jgi:hypothetical protein